MPEVVRIRKKVKEQEKKQLLSLITMDEFLLEKQKDDIVDEINSILMDATSALLLGQHPIARPISADKIALRKFYYYRLDRTHLIADIQVRVRAPRCHVTFYYSMLCTMDEDFCFGTYGFWMDKPERDELPLDKYLALHEQSTDIAAAVNGRFPDSTLGAGDQGIMYGYATDETWARMPRAFMIAQKICQLLDEEGRRLPWLGADGKAQVSLRYEGDKVFVHTIVVSVQHAPNAPEERLRNLVTVINLANKYCIFVTDVI